ncbi:glycoside hydrolase family 13 protein [Pseudoalteromonas sp. JBTF-M23]|uniref:Glycoside hydrolase family 13 protein n=1 Tax=Pseudoalteromonas caenipelagi TaxID=2726988 RepID=A0A849VGV2_9GAMM|nr:glycoside hydrolase family 13 protein [Pseudoalteromonas caenipelagi]NOU50941.1 glycoside hydrolase family 13 protein [Pseudoalteromonas caenipelagi]
MRISLVIIMSFFGFISAAKAYQLEPKNWWVGMKHPEVQIMVRKSNIVGADISLKPYKGVSISSVQYGDSPNYAFINVRIEPDAKAGELFFEVNTHGEQEQISYPLLARQTGSAQRQGFSSKDVIYLINPDRFANGNAQNDSVEGMLEKANPTYRGGRHGGDLAGIIAHLDYFKDMGYTQLWLTPVRENNMADYSYHGYALTDFYKVDPRMGSNEEYPQLTREAAKRGIGIIMDMVLNHSGLNHWWVADKPTRDWLNFEGQFSGTSHARQTIQDPHASEFDKKQFNDGWFVPTMPDLNQRQPLLATYLIQNAIWWIEYANLSGIRVDTYSYSDKAFLANWTQRIMAEYPNFNIVGEEWSSNPAITSYWQRGKVNQDGYRSSLPSVMDFSLQEALVKALNEEESWNTGWIRVYQSIANDFLYADTNNLLIFLDNHDMSRVFTELQQSLDKTQLAMTLLLTTRGIPQIYYGTEVLLDNTPSNDHGDIRIDFPGGFKGQAQDATTARGLSKSQRLMQNHVRKLTHLRQAYPALSQGALTHFAPYSGIYSYVRSTATQHILVLLNKNQQAMKVDMNRYKETLADATTAVDVLTNEVVDVSQTVEIPKMGARLLVLKHD